MVEVAVPRRVSPAATAVLLAASTLTIMAAAIVSPSLPAIQSAFPGASPLVVRQVVTLTSAAIAVTAPFAGALIQRIGSGPVLAAGMAAYTLAGTAGLWVAGIVALLASRIILGIAGGMIMTSVTTTIAGLWNGPARARMMAAQQAFASLGGVVFLPLAGILAPLGWRIPFALYAVAVVILPFALAVPLLPRRRIAPAPPDSAPPPPDSARRAQAPVVALVLGVAVIGTAVFFMAPTQIPFLLAHAGLPPVLSGVAVAASTATGIVGALLFPALRRRFDFGAIAAGSLLMLGIGWIVIGSSGSETPIGVIAGALVGGIGVGAIVPDLNVWMSDVVSGPRRATALGGLVAAIFGGQFLSPMLLAPIIGAIGIRGAFFAAAAILAILATTVATVGRRTHQKNERTER
ncbi:MFS transporter [Spelaeicoccus albus]|uniref:MFS family permease n=1 Tax=Spelaeicoccus albus TaxID=1280376 RepID=A0A7Z0A9I3_9MICO|nr:MFS transporter [Spelaeicoccus albus]NYI66884.1 MFS family permease [Spelaeicoccus albus]